MKTNKQEKKDFYSSSDTVKKYDSLRFSNAGGMFVHQSEQAVFEKFLKMADADANFLDIPCGTGRMFSLIDSLGFSHIHASDFSDEMIQFCKSNNLPKQISISKQDIYETSFKDQMFGTILSSRFLFHSDDQQRLFQEYSRLINSGGYLIFDTLNWSPRTWTSMFSKKLGGNIYTNNYVTISELARKNGFQVIDFESILIFPSFLYRFMPNILIPIIKRLELIWPDFLKTKNVWILKKK